LKGRYYDVFYKNILFQRLCLLDTVFLIVAFFVQARKPCNCPKLGFFSDLDAKSRGAKNKTLLDGEKPTDLKKRCYDD